MEHRGIRYPGTRRVRFIVTNLRRVTRLRRKKKERKKEKKKKERKNVETKKYGTKENPYTWTPGSIA